MLQQCPRTAILDFEIIFEILVERMELNPKLIFDSPLSYVNKVVIIFKDSKPSLR